MPRAIVLNTVSKASTTGGTWGDTLSANSGDSAAIPNLQSGQGRVIRMWGGDSASVSELALTAGRVESIHDPQYGIRFAIPKAPFGTSAGGKAYPLLEPPNYIDVFTGDVLTFTVTTTASDNMAVSWMTEYQDLPGVQASFATWQSVMNNRFTEIGVRCTAVASGTAGAYGTARAINADDARWTGGRWYAILGFTYQVPVVSVSFKGPMWGNFRFGAPASTPFQATDNFFVSLAQQFPGEALIPVFNGYDSGSVLVEVVDTTASTSPILDILAVECRNNPAGV